MVTDPLRSLKEHICSLYDVEELVDILGLGAMDILNAFETELAENDTLMNLEHPEDE